MRPIAREGILSPAQAAYFPRSEGVAPLVRPLLAAGVPAVIGSLWDVDDATTEELMVSFHRHYEEGSDAAEAMRAAQLGLLSKTNHNPGLRSVLAWAPFQVIGHASSPFAARAPTHGGHPLELFFASLHGLIVFVPARTNEVPSFCSMSVTPPICPTASPGHPQPLLIARAGS